MDFIPLEVTDKALAKAEEIHTLLGGMIATEEQKGEWDEEKMFEYFVHVTTINFAVKEQARADEKAKKLEKNKAKRDRKK